MIDITSSVGFAHWLLYLIPLLIVYMTENVLIIYMILIIDGIAIVLGFFDSLVSPVHESVTEVSLVNRIAGMLVLIIFSIIISFLIQTRKRYQILAGRLENANEELESFSYSAAHDLKTPLGVMKGLSTILIEDYSDSLDKEGIDYLRRISENTVRMNELISDMLKLSKITLQDLHFEQVNMSEVVKPIIDELKQTAPERIVQLHIEPGLVVMADRSLISIALSNLINNAWKYTSKQEIGEITFGSTTVKDKRVYFIKDNGCGFDMNYASNLFKPFRRLHSESEYPGTGVGLATVDRIIKKHLGRVWAESKQNEGATFYFTLPEQI
jgi:light-regulated signal transduction histidine kinase (bacteriophytochrome)